MTVIHSSFLSAASTKENQHVRVTVCMEHDDDDDGWVICSSLLGASKVSFSHFAVVECFGFVETNA